MRAVVNLSLHAPKSQVKPFVPSQHVNAHEDKTGSGKNFKAIRTTERT